MIGCRDAESRFSRSPTSPTSKEPDSRIGGMRAAIRAETAWHGCADTAPAQRPSVKLGNRIAGGGRCPRRKILVRRSAAVVGRDDTGDHEAQAAAAKGEVEKEVTA